MRILPRTIPGSKTQLSDDLTVSILIDRAMLFELEKHVLVLLSKEEVYTLYLYLERHRFKFLGADGRTTMSNYRQLKPKQMVAPQESKLSDRPLTIIARQSTTHQIEENKESFRLQIEDARQRFISQGWSQDIITIRIAGDGKKGVSGTLRIDQRSELIDTLADIKAGICKAIGVYSVSSRVS